MGSQRSTLLVKPSPGWFNFILHLGKKEKTKRVNVSVAWSDQGVGIPTTSSPIVAPLLLHTPREALATTVLFQWG